MLIGGSHIGEGSRAGGQDRAVQDRAAQDRAAEPQ